MIDPATHPVLTETYAEPAPKSHKTKRVKIQRMVRRLRSELNSRSSEAEVLRCMAELLAENIGALGIWHFQLSQKTGESKLQGILGDEEELEQATGEQILSLAKQSIELGLQKQVEPVGFAGSLLISTPLSASECDEAILVFCPGSTSNQRTEDEAFLEICALKLVQWRATNRANAVEANAVAALQTLRILGSSSRQIGDSAYIQIVNQLCEVLNCDRVFLGLVSGNEKMKLAAVSGTDHFDPQSKNCLDAISALSETAINNDVTVWSESSESKQTNIAHGQLAKSFGVNCVVSFPLQRTDKSLIGCVTLIGDKALLESKSKATIYLFSENLSGLIGLQELAKPTSIGLAYNAAQQFSKSNFGKFLIGLCVVAFLAMFVSINYRSNCEFTLEPVSKQFCSAPFDSKIEESLVQPGDFVEKGSLLARLADDDLKLELASLKSQLLRENNRRDAALRIRDVSESQIALQEMNRLKSDIELKSKRLSRLELRAPIDGIVVNGDLKELEGSPVELGQTLFEIGPLDKMRVEIAIPEEQIPYVEIGMEVVFRSDAYPLKQQSGKIKNIHPRTELRNDKSVFIAELSIANPNNQFRPGMSGQAKVFGKRCFLGWYLFHRPIEKMAIFVGL